MSLRDTVLKEFSKQALEFYSIKSAYQKADDFGRELIQDVLTFKELTLLFVLSLIKSEVNENRVEKLPVPDSSDTIYLAYCAMMEDPKFSQFAPIFASEVKI